MRTVPAVQTITQFNVKLNLYSVHALTVMKIDSHVLRRERFDIQKEKIFASHMLQTKMEEFTTATNNS